VLGVAYFGAAGDEAAQPPEDIYTKDIVKGYVNGGIRMFLNDAPLEGWRFQQPTASVILWATTTTGAITVGADQYTTFTSATADFHPSMVGHTLVADASENEYTIISYTSTTVVVVAAHANTNSDTGDTFTITADGNYTLPSTFGGEYTGSIGYAAGSNNGIKMQWTNEGIIRRLRENVDSQTGNPIRAAVRKMDATDVARRWELIVDPIPSDDVTVEFPYELHFTALSSDSDTHPAGPHYDEAILAACEAYAEMHGQDSLQGRVQYYENKALPAAHRRNLRSAPKRLGYLRRSGRRVRNWRDTIERPGVTQPS